jgi:predicted helicase
MKSLLDKNEYPMSNERVRLFLTNTLDTRGGEQSSLSDIGRALSDEAVCVSRVRSKKPILAVIGNPPYSGSSSNRGLFDQEMNIYKDAVRTEKSIRSLSDDYIKFIRFAHKQIDDQGEGVVGFITNNSYLNGLVHRGMRKELVKSFDEIYILNLYGNARLSIKTPEGGKDENVFDIRPGVSIVIFIKTSKSTDDAKVYYSELIGLRDYKYDYLNDNDINTTKWTELDVYNPYYFFEPKDFSAQNDYDKFVSVSDVFKERSSGITTSRDGLTIQPTEKEMWEVVNGFCSLNIESAREKYSLGNDSGDWSVKGAQKDITENIITKEKIVGILYRPFDAKLTYYTGNCNGIMSRPCKNIMQHMLQSNLCMCIGRAGKAINSSGDWNIILCSDRLTDYNIFYRGGGGVHPLYLYTNNTRTPNIDPNIITTLTTTYNTKPTPEDLFYYIYGILHSTTYRQKYAELLKIDFPKIPFTPDHDMFMRIGSIGKQLADIHLMKPDVFNHSAIKYCR